MKCIHHFTDPKIGMVQTRWTHINRNYSVPYRGGSHSARRAFRAGTLRRVRAAACSSTSTARRECGDESAIEEAGGWEHDTLTEDTDLSYRAQLEGWKFLYLQDVECPAELPVEMTAFKTQQARWAKGLIQVSKKILPQVLRSDRAAARQNRGLVSPDGESQLSIDDRAFRPAVAGDDYSLLSGMVSDALHRLTPVHGFDIFHIQLLSGFAEGVVSEALVRARCYTCRC